jgi:hypothetical protein
MSLSRLADDRLTPALYQACAIRTNADAVDGADDRCPAALECRGKPSGWPGNSLGCWDERATLGT